MCRLWANFGRLAHSMHNARSGRREVKYVTLTIYSSPPKAAIPSPLNPLNPLNLLNPSHAVAPMAIPQPSARRAVKLKNPPAISRSILRTFSRPPSIQPAAVRRSQPAPSGAPLFQKLWRQPLPQPSGQRPVNLKNLSSPKGAEPLTFP